MAPSVARAEQVEDDTALLPGRMLRPQGGIRSKEPSSSSSYFWWTVTLLDRWLASRARHMNVEAALDADGTIDGTVDPKPHDDRNISKDDEAESAKLLRTWLEANSIYIHPDVRISADDDACSSISVWTSAPLALGTILGTIPKSATLSPRTSGLSRWLPSSLQYFYSPEATCGLLLSTCLLYEYLCGEKSRWHGYVQSLPHERIHQGKPQFGISLPLEWDALSTEWQVIEHCEAGRIAHRANRRKPLPMTKADNVALHHVLAYYDAHVVPLFQEAGFTLKDDATTRSLFVGCYSLVSSRAFVCDTHHGLVLCPFADAFNHVDYGENEVQFECDDQPLLREEQTIDMTMTQDGVAGTELFNSYGPISNARLLTSYGFSLEYETGSERFTWDWRDDGERGEMMNVFQVDIGHWAEALSIFVAHPSIQHEILSGSLDSVMDDSDLQTSLPPLPKISPFAHLATMDLDYSPHVVDDLSSILAIDGPEDDAEGHDEDIPLSADVDAHLPFYVDQQGRISVPLWRAALLASIVRLCQAVPPPDKVKTTIRLVENSLASRNPSPNDGIADLRNSTCQALIDLISVRLARITASHPVVQQPPSTSRLDNALRHFYQEKCILDIALHNLQIASGSEDQIH